MGGGHDWVGAVGGASGGGTHCVSSGGHCPIGSTGWFGPAAGSPVNGVRGRRAPLARRCLMMAIVMAPPIPASVRRSAGMTMTRMPPAMLEPIARWLPGGAVDDVAVTRNLPG